MFLSLHNSFFVGVEKRENGNFVQLNCVCVVFCWNLVIASVCCFSSLLFRGKKFSSFFSSHMNSVSSFVSHSIALWAKVCGLVRDIRGENCSISQIPSLTYLTSLFCLSSLLQQIYLIKINRRQAFDIYFYFLLAASIKSNRRQSTNDMIGLHSFLNYSISLSIKR